MSGILDSASVRQRPVASLQPAFVRCQRHPVAFSKNCSKFSQFFALSTDRIQKLEFKKENYFNKFRVYIGYTGFEPATSTSRTSRATSCANTRKKNKKYIQRVAGSELNVPNLKIENPLKTKCESGLFRIEGLLQNSQNGEVKALSVSVP